jgi:phosphohistidine swiveling domain-containing protein
MSDTHYLAASDDPAAETLGGGKARALSRLTLGGFAVPFWMVVLPEAFLVSARAANEAWPELARGSSDDFRAFLAALRPAPEVCAALDAAIRERFPDGALLAVRSSASDEDGARHSFAGQFESFLNVPASEAAGRVAAVWASGYSERVLAYRREHGLPPLPSPPAVIIQRMVDAEAAGVAFGVDPVTGQRGVAVISAVRGLGEALVSGEADADAWEIDRACAVASRQIADERPALTDDQARAVADLAWAAGRFFKRPQDIEWAFDRTGKLWLLQSRPVTGLESLPEADGPLNIWDNSNIAESYGGVTTPLTFSFARRVYEEVYRQFCRLMGVPRWKIEQHDDVFPRMLGLVRGRIYYNLLNWHRLLALLPGYQLNRPFMEGMMSVKEPLPAEAQAQLARENGPAPGAAARWRDALALGRSIVGLFWNGWRLPRQIDAFYARLNEALADPQPPLDAMRADELAAHYRMLERQLLTRWDAPLVNDFFAMIFFGVLRKISEKWCGDKDGSLPNELLSAGGGIISAEPARRLRELAALAARAPEFAALLREGSTPRIERALEGQLEFAACCHEYFNKFADRCLEELKLETLTLLDNPLMFYRTVGRLASNIATNNINHLTESSPKPVAVAEKAAARVADALRGQPVRRLVFGWVLKHARERVRGRENLRFERTRVFGRVRRIFVELGRRWCVAGRIDDERDIFWLTLEETLGLADGTTASVDARGIVNVRRAEFESYQKGPPPADRFETRGAVHLGNSFAASTRARPAGGRDDASTNDAYERRGTPCCAGLVRGLARVVLDPRTAEIQPGEILIAPRTDPGWILLFPGAAGLAVEHGSLLSHSAIVARELQLPAVVAVPGLTTWLRTGDLIELDGAAGHVRRLQCVEARDGAAIP